jgi:hypothetical protein
MTVMAVSASAQVLYGVATDSEDDSTLIGVVIQNKTHPLTTTSDLNGRFSIVADKGDEIEFTYFGYNAFSMQMPEGKVYRKIALRKKLFALDEVVIGPDYTPYQKDSIERRKTYKLALNRQRASSSVVGSVFSPMSALAEQFNKQSKQIYRFQQNFVKWEGQKYMDTKYSFEDVGKLTGLSGDTLGAFINAYPMPYDFARTATEIEIKMWIKYNYREWIKKPIVLPPAISMPHVTTDTLNKP